MRNKYVSPSALCWMDDGGQGAAPAGLASQHSLTSTLSSPFTRHGPPLHVGKPPPGVQTPLAQPSPSPRYHLCPLYLSAPSHPSSPTSSKKFPGLSSSLSLQTPSSEFPKPWLSALPPDLFTGSLDCQAWSSCRDFALKKYSTKLCRWLNEIGPPRCRSGKSN